MPAYGTDPVRALYPGETIALVNDASVDTGITTTQAFSVGPNPTQNSNAINFHNSTNQDATGQLSPDNSATGTYKNLSGLVVAAGTALPYNLAGGFVRFTFGSAPTSGSLTAVR